MSDPIPTLIAFRDQVASKYRGYGRLAGVSVLIFIISAGCCYEIAHVTSLLSAGAGVSLLYLTYLHTHRRRMIAALDQDVRRSNGHFEAYMDGHHLRWENHALVRLITGTILAAIFFSLVIFKVKGPVALLAAALFIAFIIGVMLKNWLQFCERILVQDFRRQFRD